MKTAQFRSPDLQKKYEDWGYILIRNFLDKSEISQLLGLFHAHYPQVSPTSTLWNSLCDIPHEKSFVLSDAILRIVKPKLDAYFTDYLAPAATFLVKNPLESGNILLHRDFSVQDEENYSYQNIWLPLVDTTPENGQLCVLRRSHHFFNYPLPHNIIWPYREHEGLMMKYCDFIDAKAGDVIVYNDRTLHASYPNKTSGPRPVVHFGLLHPQAELLYHYLDEETGEVTAYEVPFQFFFKNLWGNQDGKYPVFKKFKYEPPQLSRNEIAAWLEANVGAKEVAV